ncbi:nucleoside/nucleotide kinase family protein [Rhodovulum sulfidophilum]|uniref:AAA family ATPase n=1 Tax=Rhodovulum sulfidophilum TaxID=35806 RepID=A0ABS1RZS3_RHOSU|nr:AAA family ATPase [Rhodovulum sulfidophilum]MBL3610580.1 AAA family ATPase [Rhodovulum sulfidophilum]MCE8456627.1 AAA family ATPase [Rhodovulum sulfidophilum]
MLDQNAFSNSHPPYLACGYIGIEGPGCSGKTTLLKSLIARHPTLAQVPEYYELNNCQPFAPPSTVRTPAIQRDVLALLLHLEERRQDIVREAARQRLLAVSDRTFLSCIAYDYARSHVEADIDWRKTERRFSQAEFQPPALILYLTTPDNVRSHYADKIGIRKKSMTRHPVFLEMHRAYFEHHVSRRIKTRFVSVQRADAILSSLSELVGS